MNHISVSTICLIALLSGGHSQIFNVPVFQTGINVTFVSATFIPDYSNQSSAAFYLFINPILRNLTIGMSSAGITVINGNVIGLSPGSVIAFVVGAIAYETDSTSAASAALSITVVKSLYNVQINSIVMMYVYSGITLVTNKGLGMNSTLFNLYLMDQFNKTISPKLLQQSILVVTISPYQYSVTNYNYTDGIIGANISFAVSLSTNDPVQNTIFSIINSSLPNVQSVSMSRALYNPGETITTNPTLTTIAPMFEDWKIGLIVASSVYVIVAIIVAIFIINKKKSVEDYMNPINEYDVKDTYGTSTGPATGF